MRLVLLGTLAAVVLGAPGAVLAQGAPPPPAPVHGSPQPQHPVDSAFALGVAYREIGRAEQAGATGHYIDSARTHYLSAISRHNRSDDPGASAEARLASDLARVAIDQRPANAGGPRDIPAPPAPRSANGETRSIVIDDAPGAVSVTRGMQVDGPMPFDHGPMQVMATGFRVGPRGFDATHLAKLLQIETSAEARQLAQNAVDANTAAQKAALAGNVAEASRQTRLSEDLAMSVQDLAELNHPELRRMTMQVRVGELPPLSP